MPIEHAIVEMYSNLTSEADLQLLIDDKVQEGLYLEFKKKKNASTGDLDDSDKRQFSRALSGFANSGGGLLLWGVEGDQSERATALRPIDDVLKFQAALKKSILNSTQPVVDDVVVDVIFVNGSTTRGFVKCLIPQSERTPHRAMMAEREYFKRSTEGFYRLEHFDLEDMFGRRPVPRLDLVWEVRSGMSMGGWDGHKQDVNVHLTLINRGRGSARAPYVELTTQAPYEVKPSGVSSGSEDSIFRWLDETTTKSKFLGRSEFSIHPETGFEFAVIKRRFSDKENLVGDLQLSARVAAENARVREFTLTFPVANLLSVVGWSASGPPNSP